MADAIDVEARRQIALLERGERVRQETRGYNADKRETYLLRDKEGEAGYRYFPEPDLPPLVLDDAFVEELRHALPPGPAARKRRLVDELGLTPQAAAVLTAHPQIAAFYETTVLLYPEAVKAANFIQSEVLRDARMSGLSAEIPVSPGQVAELLGLVDRGTISGKQAKEVYARMRGTPALPSAIVRERGMSVISDEAALEAMARRLVADNPKQAESYRAGKANLLGFFVGQMMKQTGGSADPAVVNRVLKRVLAGEGEGPTGERAVLTPENTGLSIPALGSERTESGLPASPASPGSSPSGRRDRDDQSPLAQSVAPPPPPPPEHTTLTSASAAMLPPASENSAEEAFVRLDLRVGRVVTAERVFRKEKLLALSVDVGEEAGPRRILAALALSFAPEDLVGKRVIVACNVTPGISARGSPPRGRSSSPGSARASRSRPWAATCCPAPGSGRPMAPRVPIRAPLRTAGFIGLTFGLLAGFEAERALARDDHARDDVTYKWMARYGHGLLRLYGLEVTARGAYVEAEGGRYPARDAAGRGRLFVMNHRSMLDIFVNLAFLEANIVSRADLSGWPVIGLAARRVGTLFVDRKSKQSGAAVINAICGAVERGRAVMVYPEGTTFSGDEVRPFRAGAFLAAQRTGAEIVPVGIAYEGDAASFGDEPFVKHLLRVSSARRTRVGLEIGEPIRADRMDVDAVRALTQERVQALVHEARARLARGGEAS